MNFAFMVKLPIFRFTVNAVLLKSWNICLRWLIYLKTIVPLEELITNYMKKTVNKKEPYLYMVSASTSPNHTWRLGVKFSPESSNMATSPPPLRWRL